MSGMLRKCAFCAQIVYIAFAVVDSSKQLRVKRWRGLSLGGEQSGHIIFSEHLFTGDGIVTALSVLRVMAETGRELADLAAELVTYPQVLLNVRVREKKDFQAVPEIADSLRRVEQRLAGHGRLLVRYSGTEPLLRVMIEGRDQHEIQGWASEIVSTVKEHLG